MFALMDMEDDLMKMLKIDLIIGIGLHSRSSCVDAKSDSSTT